MFDLFDDIDLVVLFLNYLQVLFLLHVIFMQLSLVLLLGFGDFVETGFDNGIDLSSNVAFPLIVLFKMLEQVGGLRGVAFEQP